MNGDVANIDDVVTSSDEVSSCRRFLADESQRPRSLGLQQSDDAGL